MQKGAVSSSPEHHKGGGEDQSGKPGNGIEQEAAQEITAVQSVLFQGQTTEEVLFLPLVQVGKTAQSTQKRDTDLKYPRYEGKQNGIPFMAREITVG